MITDEHLKHWIGEINWQLNGIVSEINADKVVMGGINVGKSGESWVSFEYLREKAGTIQGLLRQIQWDMEHDEISLPHCPICNTDFDSNLELYNHLKDKHDAK